MVRIISVSSQKGGTAKTTTTISAGYELAAGGARVLLIDMDPQGHLAEGLGLSAGELAHEISEVLDRRISLAEILIPLYDNLTLAPANIRLAHLENYLVTKTRREDRLKGALAPLADDYDFILIDCPPSLGILTVNAFSAAQEVLIPMATEFYALLGVGLLLDTIRQMRAELNPDLSITGILPTRLTHTNHARAVVERVETDLPEVHLFSPIPEAVAVREATAAGKPIQLFDPRSPAAVAYSRFVQELCQCQSVQP